jgi:protein-tyrosine phosphatase
VLFVCLGNICRSPTAEAVFRAAVERAGVADAFVIDSCGTGGGSSNWYKSGGFSYHEGDAADSRMTQVAASRDVRLTSCSRPLSPRDLSEFDLIVGMDADNIAAVKLAAEHWRAQPVTEAEVPADYAERVRLMTDFFASERWRGQYDHVPDPYYGGQKGFELVLDLLEDACSGLLAELAPGGK